MICERLGVGMTNAIEKIQSEHSEYERVLSCLCAVVRYFRVYDMQRLRAPGLKMRAKVRPDLDLLFSIIYYIRIFPDNFHHPKEERYLFRAVRKRSPKTGDILDQLVRQHAIAARQVAELDAALKAYEKHYPNGLEDLTVTAESFVALQRKHMRLEEEKVIPVAKAVLTQDDWREIDNAFASYSDPLFGENLETAFQSLHDRIVHGVEAA